MAMRTQDNLSTAEATHHLLLDLLPLWQAVLQASMHIWAIGASVMKCC